MQMCMKTKEEKGKQSSKEERGPKKENTLILS